MNVDDAVVAVLLCRQSPTRQDRPLDRPVGPLGQVAQDVELLRGERRVLTAGQDPARVELDDDVGERDRSGLARGLLAEADLDSRDQLLEKVGLGHVIGGAEIEALESRGQIALGRQDDHREVGALADLAQHVEAVHLGEHQIQDDAAGLEVDQALAHAGAGRHQLDQPTLFPEATDQVSGDGGIVLDHQHPQRGLSHVRPPLPMPAPRRLGSPG